MKKIENRTMDAAVEGGKGSTYAEMCKVAINNVPKEGFTVEEMRRRLKIMDALDAAKDKTEILIEDADLATLKHCVSEVRWIRLDKAIVAFVDHVAAVA